MSNNYSLFKRVLAACWLLIMFNLNAQECLPPIGLVSGSTGMAHARMYWTAPQAAPAMGYDWELTLQGNTTVIQSGTAQAVTLLLTNLEIQTVYTLKVRSHCSETAASSWTESTFTTQSAVTTAEGQVGFGEISNALFGASYGPMMYAGIAQRNGSVANMLFTATEMQSLNIPQGANITGVAFDKINGAYGGDAYPDLRLRMFAKNSTAEAPLSMTTTYGDIQASHTEVMDNPAYDLPATIGWINFDFETPIAYSGSGFELATAMYQNGQTAQFSSFIVWQCSGGLKDYMVGAWPINTVPMSDNLVLSHSSGGGQYKERPNIKFFYEVSNAVTGINVFTQNNVAATITQNQGTLQLVAPIAPSSVSQEKIWQIISGSQYASVSATGLITALDNGTITVQATSADNSTITDTIEITISNQTAEVTAVDVTVAGNAAATITTDNGTLQLAAAITPAEANQNVVWSTISGNAFAYMTQDGIVHAINNGTAVIQAVSAENNTILDTIEVTITGQVAAATALTISVANNAEPVITANGGTLQLIATVTPSNAIQTVTWSTISGNAFAYMTQDGIVHAINNGTAVIQAVSTTDNTILDTIEITISGQVAAATSLTISVANNAEPVITANGGTLQLIATVTPSNAIQTVTWSTISGNAFAYMTQDGIVHAINNGTAVIQAVSTTDNTILDTIEIVISGQVLGLDEFNKDEVIVFPNPAQSIITLQSQYEISQVAIYTIDGKKALEGTGNTINIESLPQGNYLLKAQSQDGKILTRKIVKN